VSSATSLFDLYKIGIGPSSSHTMGPMRAAGRFADELVKSGRVAQVARVQVDLYGSLALTGKGHCTDRGVLLGLMGYRPDTVPPGEIDALVTGVEKGSELNLAAKSRIRFHLPSDLLWHRSKSLPRHPNGIRFTAYAAAASGAEAPVLDCRTYYSVGGGFVIEEGETQSSEQRAPVPFPFCSSEELLEHGRRNDLRIDEILLRNELTWRSLEEVESGIERLWHAMRDCVERGMRTEGVLPGGLKVPRRAAGLAANLRRGVRGNDPLDAMEWLNVYAMAVNEENAAGGRVVTAPTNGAAGIVPAVLYYLARERPGDHKAIEKFFLTSAAIGVLYKENASISGAEVGCQGEVGVACSMAAGGLAAALGGSNGQVENAAEIAMEHNLGMTCDPIGGLVQIPCIERNAFGTVKAVNAARMALRGTGEHKVSLDQVIKTMYQTGMDMQSRYKETSLGGLAVNVIEC
jgi:L-serine dehydratase